MFEFFFTLQFAVKDSFYEVIKSRLKLRERLYFIEAYNFFIYENSQNRFVYDLEIVKNANSGKL